MNKSTKQQHAALYWSTLTTPGPFDFCPVRTPLNVLGDKWKLFILSSLFQDPQRYGELRRLLPEITEKMLIQELRELHGIAQRVVYQQVPLKVKYSLTEQGQRVQPMMTALMDWGQGYLSREGATCPPAERSHAVAR